MDFTKALVELMTWLSRKKRDEAFAVSYSRDRTEMINNRQKVGIREQNVTELVTIIKDDDEPQSHLSSTRPDDNNGLVRTENGSKYPSLLVEASIKSIRRTWTTNLSFMGRKKSIQHEFEIVSDYPVSV